MGAPPVSNPGHVVHISMDRRTDGQIDRHTRLYLGDFNFMINCQQVGQQYQLTPVNHSRTAYYHDGSSKLNWYINCSLKVSGKPQNTNPCHCVHVKSLACGIIPTKYQVRTLIAMTSVISPLQHCSGIYYTGIMLSVWITHSIPQCVTQHSLHMYQDMYIRFFKLFFFLPPSPISTPSFLFLAKRFLRCCVAVNSFAN